MRNMKTFIMGAATLACVVTASEGAQAQSIAFGAGATFPMIVYRQMFDCLYSQVQGGGPNDSAGPLAKAPSCPGFNSLNVGGGILYAGIGSGGGKAVLRGNDPALINNYSISNAIPYTDTHGTFAYSITGAGGGFESGGYDGLQFIGSDDIVIPSDVQAWNTAGNPAKFGNLIQLPALVGPVGVGFNGKDGTGATLNILKSTPTGGSSGLNLDRQALCGIASGHITKWNNPILTALNGGVLGSGDITFVHRTDGSGTTFLFSNAMVAQCRGQFGPSSETDSTIVSYEFPWTDHAATCPGLTVNKPVGGANQLNWPDQFATDQCGNSVTSAGHFLNASGTGALVNLVAATNGAIGYASADYWAPVKAGGLKTANLQSQWDVSNGTGEFQPMTAAGAQAAMATAVPQFASAEIRANPLAWSLQGVVPNPAVKGSYPIAGFTWIEMYQCYQPHSNGNNPILWFQAFQNFLYSPASSAILADNGFAGVPGQWGVEVATLLADATYGVQMAGQNGCSAVSPGAY